MSMTPDTFEMVARLHPMRGQPLFKAHPEGATLAEIVEGVGVEPRFMSSVQVTISGETNSTVVPFEQWHLVRPRAGSHVLVAPRVHGPLAALALSAALPQFAATVAGTWFGLASGTLAYGATYAAVTVVGSLLINALIPPPDAPQLANQETNYSITGAGNAENRYGVYPTVLGRHQIYPPKTARGYTEGEGDTIYFRGRFTFGYGPVALETLQIGTTSITEFEGVELEFLNVDEAETLAHMPDLAPMVTAWRQGTEAMSLYPDDVAEDTYSVGLEQDVPVIRVTRERAISVSVDVTYNGLIKYDDKGRSLSETEDIKFRYRKIGDAEWTDAGTETHTGKTSASTRFTKAIDLPDTGQYEIEVTRLTEDRESSSVRDEPFLTAVRSVQSGALPSHENIAEVALRIQASEQLNGQLADLNGIALQMAPVWDGASWSAPQPVRHPAWIYARALMGPMLEKPVGEARIQLDDLKAWADEEPHWTCDAVIDQSSTVAQVLDIICATGRARRVLRDLKYSIIRDGGAGPIVQQFTPRNSYGFEGSITFPKEIHGFRVRCISERLGWQQDEITVYADGYDASNATDFETLDLTGVVLSMDETEGNPWRLGRYHLAQAILRPEEFRWQSDMDHLACNMGDKVRLVHDVPMIGVGVGRIKELLTDGAGNITTLTLDEAFSLGGAAYRLIIRKGPGGETVIDAAPPVSWGGPWIPSVDVSGTGVGAGDLVQVVEMGQEGLEVLITSITHSGNMQASLTGVPASPAVLQADQGEIPAYVPTITTVVPNDRMVPAPPRLVSISSQNVSQEDETGGRGLVVYAELVWLPGAAYSGEGFLVYMTGPDGMRAKVDQTAATTGRYLLPSVGSYTFEVIAQNVHGLSEAARGRITRGVAAETPANVTGFMSTVSGQQLKLVWNMGEAIVSHYVLRYLAPDAPGGWRQAALVDQQILGNQIVLPARSGRYLIKAVSLFARESESETEVIVESAGLDALNVVETLTEHPEFSGSRTAGLSTNEGSLFLLSDSAVSEWPSLADVGSIGGFGGVEPNGVYEFANMIDLSEVYSSRIAVDVRGYGYRLDELMSSWGSLAELDNLVGTGSDAWAIEVQVSTTQDAPNAGGAVWSDWLPLQVGDYLARGLRFRLILASDAPAVAVRVDHAAVTVDMPDRVMGGDDIQCPANGIYVPIAPAFKAKPAISVDGQELPSGARSIRTNVSREGFHQQFVDQSGAGVACSFDWVAKGYGRVQ